jgi:hypothetical protein
MSKNVEISLSFQSKSQSQSQSQCIVSVHSLSGNGQESLLKVSNQSLVFRYS